MEPGDLRTPVTRHTPFGTVRGCCWPIFQAPYLG